MSYVEPLMRQNFLEYASYVIVDRAIPDVRDGCKPVQRRILHTLHEMDDGRFHKVANIIGETMKLHPHGEASIGDALVVLANKQYFIERQGNFGSVMTGHPAAAPRYIECRLTELARDTLFNPDLTEFAPSYDGRKQEPVSLPCKVPVILMLGTEGIAVGMATKILPHNFDELLDAQMRYLKGQKFQVYPDFQQGGIMDVSEWDDGRGKVRIRARLKVTDEKTIVISEVPFSTTTGSLINSIEAAAQKGKFKVSSIEDRTAEKVEIVVSMARGVYAEDVLPLLYAYTNCEVSITSNIVTIVDERPEQLTVSDLLKTLTDRLREQIRLELEHELDQLESRRHYLTLEQIFIENRIYKRIEEARTAAAVKQEVYDGMEPFRHLFVRDMVDEDVSRLLELRIRRISAYDINKNRKEIDDIVKAIEACRKKLENLTATTVAYLRALRKKYGAEYPRRTEISGFDAVDKRDVALENIKLNYDAKTGFCGSTVRGKDVQLAVTEFDKILAVCQDGSYRVFTPSEKFFIPGKVVHLDKFDTEEGQVLTILYSDRERYAFAKKVHIKGVIKEKEYELIKNKAGRILKLFVGEVDHEVHLDFVPAKGQRIKEARFRLKTLDFCGVTARGTRLALKPVAHLRLIKKKVAGKKTGTSAATPAARKKATKKAPSAKKTTKKKKS